MEQRSEPGDSRVRIMIVDADGRVRRALRALIETQTDMTVVAEADSSTAALEYASTLHPSVIVLDLMLPTTEAGLTVVALLTQCEQMCVAVSWQGGLGEAALQMGARGFVEKGAPPEHILATIRGGSAADGKVALDVTGDRTDRGVDRY